MVQDNFPAIFGGDGLEDEEESVEGWGLLGGQCQGQGVVRRAQSAVGVWGLYPHQVEGVFRVGAVGSNVFSSRSRDSSPSVLGA